MAGYHQFPKFGGAFDDSKSTIIPEDGDAELARNARLHGTGNGIRKASATNFGTTITYIAGEGSRPKRAVSGNIEEFDGRNWIVTITPFNQSNTNSQWLRDLRARIQFGVGGGNSVLDVSVLPNAAIAIPALFIAVDIVPPANLTPSEKHDFSVTLHRGQPNGDSESRLFTELVNQGNALTANLVTIPAFAKRVQTLGASGEFIYAAGAQITFANITSAGSLNYTGPELLALKNAGQKIEIPAGCKLMIVQGLPNLEAAAFSWDIEI